MKFTHDPQCTFGSFSMKERTCHYFPLYTKYNHSSNSTILISANCTHISSPPHLSSFVYKIKDALIISETLHYTSQIPPKRQKFHKVEEYNMCLTFPQAFPVIFISLLQTK